MAEVSEQKPPPAAPDGYVYTQGLFDDWGRLDKTPFWLLLLWANLLALLPLAVAVLFLWLPYQFYRALGTPYALLPEWTLPLPWSIGLGIAIILLSMVVHEWLHGLALGRLGYQPRYAFNKFYLLATIEKGTYLSRPRYLIMTLTPIIVMTSLGGLSLIVIPPALGQSVLIALLLNAAASLGDMMVAMRVYQTHPAALFAISFLSPPPSAIGRRWISRIRRIFRRAPTAATRSAAGIPRSYENSSINFSFS